MKKIILILICMVSFNFVSPVFAASSYIFLKGHNPGYFPVDGLVFDGVGTIRSPNFIPLGGDLALTFFSPSALNTPHDIFVEFSTDDINPQPGAYYNAINLNQNMLMNGPAFELLWDSTSFPSNGNVDFTIFEAEYDLQGNALKFAADFDFIFESSYLYSGKVRFNSDYDLTSVVPEPVSSMLMLIGGGAMVLRRRLYLSKNSR